MIPEPGESTPFSDEQKQYLHGLLEGYDARRRTLGVPTFASTLAAIAGNESPSLLDRPSRGAEDIHRTAQDRFLAAGRKLSSEEEAKRQGNPLDVWDDLRRHAEEGRFPKGLDVYRFKFHGLFYVAPAQDSFMCRLRIPNGILTSHQMRGVAEIAERFGGGHADVTGRANLQIREIHPENILAVLTALEDLGLCSRGAGADNIRNITGTPTAGIDAQEIIDTRPLARDLHHHILNHRELYGLPRKFNIAFDGGGTISSLEDTNDIGFAAVRVARDQQAAEGVYFRVLLGGITGHGDFARDAGVILEPRDCLSAAAAMVRVFIDHGDRTDRKKARLKYLLERWGLEKFLSEAEQHFGRSFTRLPPGACEPRGPVRKHGHVGFHPQRQPGFFYAGIVLPMGRMRSEQMRRLADAADRHGSGTIRLTVWQNLLISDVPGSRVPELQVDLLAMGLNWSATNVCGGLVACTGNRGCKYSATDTKGHALALGNYLDARLSLDQPINIHFTGCPHSCAQHAIGDIGLLGVKVAQGEDVVEGYRVFVGGGYGSERGCGREIFRNIPASDLLNLLEGVLRGYLDHRVGQESFREFTERHSTEALLAVFQLQSRTTQPTTLTDTK